MKRTFYLSTAVLIFLFFNYGFYKWLQQGHTFKNVWRSITNDWLVAIIFFDALIFITICIAWLITDMKKRGLTKLQMILVILALIITGSVTFFVYLAYRNKILNSKHS